MNKVLHEANLRGVNLRGADLRGYCLHRANLREADLTEANLRGADLTGADLRGAKLRRSDLRGADLTGADMCAADLTEADLWNANLTHVNLRGADLTGANLCEANLYNAEIPFDLGISFDAGPSGTGWLVRSDRGWIITIGCFRRKTLDDLRDLIADRAEWPSARGAEKDRRRPYLRAALAMCEAHIAYLADFPRYQ